MNRAFSTWLLITTPAWAALTLASSDVARAAVVASEAFDYVDGTLSDQDGGSGAWSTRWIGSGFNVADGQADGLNTIPANLNEIRRHFANAQATSQLFVGFDLQTPASFTADDFAGVTLSAGVGGTVLSLGKLPGSNELQVGNGGYVSSGITIQSSTSYHVVGAYDVGPNTLSLWVNPDPTDYYMPATGANTADATKIQPGLGHAGAVYLDTSRPGFKIDNLVLSDTPQGIGLNAAPPQVFNIDTTNGPTWDRPNIDGSGPSGLIVPYNVISFHVKTNGAYTFGSRQSAIEQVLFLYRSTKPPEVLPGFQEVWSLIKVSVFLKVPAVILADNITRGETYYLVSSGLDLDDVGASTLYIAGPGPGPDPEPVIRVADYDNDGVVDAGDFTVWSNAFGDAGDDLAGDDNQDGHVDGDDFLVWQRFLGEGQLQASQATVPEPSSLIICGLLLPMLRRRARLYRPAA